jgi:hypothetical protein
VAANETAAGLVAVAGIAVLAEYLLQVCAALYEQLPPVTPLIFSTTSLARQCAAAPNYAPVGVDSFRHGTAKPCRIVRLSLAFGLPSVLPGSALLYHWAAALPLDQFSNYTWLWLQLLRDTFLISLKGDY